MTATLALVMTVVGVMAVQKTRTVLECIGSDFGSKPLANLVVERVVNAAVDAAQAILFFVLAQTFDGAHGLTKSRGGQRPVLFVAKECLENFEADVEGSTVTDGLSWMRWGGNQGRPVCVAVCYGAIWVSIQLGDGTPKYVFVLRVPNGNSRVGHRDIHQGKQQRILLQREIILLRQKPGRLIHRQFSVLFIELCDVCLVHRTNRIAH